MTSVLPRSPWASRSVNSAGHRAIGFRRMLGVVGLDVVVRVPRIGVLIADAAGKNLNEPDAAFDKAARHQALPSERLADDVVEAIQLLRRLRLTRDVDGARRAPLHAIRELVGRDSRRQLAVSGKLLHVELVELRQRIEPRPL